MTLLPTTGSGAVAGTYVPLPATDACIALVGPGDACDAPAHHCFDNNIHRSDLVRASGKLVTDVTCSASQMAAALQGSRVRDGVRSAVIWKRSRLGFGRDAAAASIAPSAFDVSPAQMSSLPSAVYAFPVGSPLWKQQSGGVEEGFPALVATHVSTGKRDAKFVFTDECIGTALGSPKERLSSNQFNHPPSAATLWYAQDS